MEIKAYMEGILRAWWFIGLLLALSFWMGGIIAHEQMSQYSASTSILINDTLLTNAAFPSGVVQIGTPLSYQPQVTSPTTLNTIIEAYPGLTYSELREAIVVSTDSINQLLFISVTNTSPKSAADIANLLAQRFVSTQIANLNRQVDDYENWLRQNIAQLNDEISRLRRSTEQYRLDSDERVSYNYQQALTEIQNSRPLLKNAYLILQPATVSDVPTTAILSTSRIRLIAVATGLLVAIILIVVLEYFHPFVRHEGELQRIAGLPVLGTSPQMFSFEQKRLLQLRPVPVILRRRMKSLRLLCASIGASAVKYKGHTVLLTSPRRKRSFAAVLATFLAYNGHQILLIDANFKQPYLHEQIKLSAPCKLVTDGGLLLSFIGQATMPHLFVLPAMATLAQNERLTSISLIALLPELQNIFDIIIIDAPPFTDADTHLLATKVAQTLLLVKKRGDSLKTLKMTHTMCQELKLKADCLLLA